MDVDQPSFVKCPVQFAFLQPIQSPIHHRADSICSWRDPQMDIVQWVNCTVLRRGSKYPLYSCSWQIELLVPDTFWCRIEFVKWYLKWRACSSQNRKFWRACMDRRWPIGYFPAWDLDVLHLYCANIQFQRKFGKTCIWWAIPRDVHISVCEWANHRHSWIRGKLPPNPHMISNYRAEVCMDVSELSKWALLWVSLEWFFHRL